MLQLCQIFINFQHFLTYRLSGKCTAKSSLQMPQHLKRVAALAYEISMFNKAIINIMSSVLV